MKKSKRNRLLVIGYWLLVIGLLFYTRLINLGWGLPYPMHPDERNMANAIQSLNCDLKSQNSNLKDCFNPHFFAYGQFPLYLAYLLVLFLKFWDGDLAWPIGFSEATVSLRLISAAVSILTVIIIIKIIKIITEREPTKLLLTAGLLSIFSPYAIQFAHFGTTESLLIFFYLLIIYQSLLLIMEKISQPRFLIFNSLVSGLALATKISSVIFLILPVLSLSFVYLKPSINQKKVILKRFPVKKWLFSLVSLVAMSTLIGILFSPHSLISARSFVETIKYESAVATGKIPVFYTRQFEGSIPIVFQLEKIFPYALGWPVFVLGGLGGLGGLGRLGGLGWREGRLTLLRLAFLIYFIPNAFLFTKWTRFMAPVMPIILIFAILMMERIKVIKIIKVIIVIIAILPGIAYLSVYKSADVRFQASEWIDKNIPQNSYTLSETANVVDIPLPKKNSRLYQVINFDFYELDNSPALKEEFKQHLRTADYIIIPSRRVFMNHGCFQVQSSKFKVQSLKLKRQDFKNKYCQNLKQKYPLINDYYEKLFSGALGFKPVIEFSSYPKINFPFSVFRFQLEFPDETAEETWTVFDHPVVRVYKKSR